MRPFVYHLSKIGEFCESIVPSILTEMICNFPEWASDKLFAPIEKKVEQKISSLEEKLWYKIEHKSNTNI